MAYQPLLYTHLPYHNDSIIVKTDAHRKTHEERKQEGRRKKEGSRKEDARRKEAGRKMQEERKQEDFFITYLPLTLFQDFERVVQGLHVRACWRPNINFLF